MKMPDNYTNCTMSSCLHFLCRRTVCIDGCCINDAQKETLKKVFEKKTEKDCQKPLSHEEWCKKKMPTCEDGHCLICEIAYCAGVKYGTIQQPE